MYLLCFWIINHFLKFVHNLMLDQNGPVIGDSIGRERGPAGRVSPPGPHFEVTSGTAYLPGKGVSERSEHAPAAAVTIP